MRRLGPHRRKPLYAIGAMASALALVLACTPASSLADPGPDPAAWIFDPGAVVAIDLELPQTSIDGLELDHEEYQPATFSLAVPGENHPPLSVGVRLKGGESFRSLSAKAAFKVKFDDLVSDQTFFGLEKLTLNNMVQDPSMVHEALAYEAFRSTGVAAPRTGYAYLRVNGEDFGLYLNVETLDGVSLPRWFDSTRHLYEGAYGTDVSVGGASAFEVDEGSKSNRSDLEALIAAANESQGDWSEGMEGAADLQQMTRMWAVERYVGHWDGYAGTVGEFWPNNFYLHSDDAGLFRMLPWGTDQTWGVRLSFDGRGGLMFDRCLADPSCSEMYTAALGEARASIAALDLDSRAADLAQTLLPWQERDPRREHSLAEIGEAVEATRAFIAARPGDVAAWFGDLGNEPIAEPTGTAPSTGQPPASPAMRVGRTALAGDVLVTRLRLPGTGRVSQRVAIGTAGGAVEVCSTRAQVKEAGFLALRCQLSVTARQRLRLRWLRLRVETQFAPQGASPETIDRTILARRSEAGER